MSIASAAVPTIDSLTPFTIAAATVALDSSEISTNL